MREQYPDDINLKTADALILQYRKQPEQALALIREVLQEDPTDMHALLVELQSLDRLQRHEELLERLYVAVDYHPTDKRLRMQLARSLARSDVKQAVEQYTVLSRLYPEDEGITLALALLSREIGNEATAEAELGSLVNSPVHGSRARFFLARMAEQDQRYTAAIKLYQQVPPGQEFLVANNRLAVIAKQREGLDKARQRLAEQRRRYPDAEADLYVIEAELLQRARRYDEGHALLTTALKKHPANTDLLYSRSLFSSELEKVDLLEKDLRIILAAEPDNAAALNALGYSLAILTDRLDEAQQLVEKALDIRPSDPAIMDSVGWVAYRQGKLALARQHLEAAFEKSKDHEIAAHLGEVLWKLGLEDEARDVWQQGLEETPDSPRITETMQRLDTP